MKLLMLTDGIAPFVIGGMQKHSYELVRHLASAGHQITLVHCIYNKSPLPDSAQLTEAFGEAASRNIEFITMRFPQPAWYPGHYVKESYIFSKWIYDKIRDRLMEFDFIYAKGFTAWYFLEKKRKGQRMPPVGIKFHGYEMLQTPANLKMKLHNLILRGPVIWNNKNADYIFSYGGKISEIIRSIGVPDQKIIEIPTGIESSWIRSHIAGQNDDVCRFIFIGRFERRKGIEEINKALQRITSQKKWEFHFVGPIPPSARLRLPQVTYHGSITDKNELMQLLDKCNVLVAPSHSEGMPNVIMEAMSRGLAVLTTDVGAITSVVSDINGWFVTPGDDQTLEASLTEILNLRREELHQKQSASLEKIRQFSWDKIAEDTARVISRVCN
jgi:glycosyltransferase involved in cell wall biosynthesis